MSLSTFTTAFRRYPIRRQLEESDCGPACLEMVAAHHGAKHALAALKELTHVQNFGTTLLDLATAAEQLGFRARGVHVEDPSDLEDEEGQALLPAIAHWNEEHFVVLYEVTPKEAVVGDPAMGLRRIPSPCTWGFSCPRRTSCSPAASRSGIVYETESELSDDTPVAPALKAAPEIRLEHVTFRYGSPHEPPILDDVSFTLPAGKMTAIVGRSGAGKTTLSQVLYGLHRPQAGRILYDGQPMETFSPVALRRSVAFVFQKTDIFDGTLAENIALGDSAPDRERLLHAARTACLDELLALPNGLNTRIGEVGIRLSGGEEQRLQLARAIYRDPRLLFLDEATSHLDATLERAITEALQREAHGRTLVVVAHRLSTVRRADKVVVLEKGRVVEEGTHEELVALPNGRYRALVENQLEG